MKEWTFIVDIAKCHNCNNCLMACKDEHVENDWGDIAAPQPQHGHYWIKLNRKERGSYPLVDAVYLPQPCQHCVEPACLKAAKNNAVYKRDDGIVIIDPEKAKGQRDLVDVCPYNNIYWNDQLAIPQKCTMCAHLLDEGWAQPRCVQACPTGALSFVQKDVSGEKGLEDLHSQFKTKPRVKYKNLYRYEKCFIGGSVALQDTDECAENAKVTLRKGSKALETVNTNNYGDFRFDNLDEKSGKYSLEINYPGYEAQKVSVDLKDSINIGTIFL